MKTSEHPSAAMLAGYVEGELEERAGERVEEHLLAGCVRCLRSIRDLAAEQGGRRGGAGLRVAKEGRGDRGGLIDLAVMIRHAEAVEREGRLVEAERIVASQLLREVLLLASDERRSALRAAGRYRFYGLAELLIEECRRECFQDVARAVELGYLAVEAADSLSVVAYPPGLVIDTRALAWGALGNAHRVRADLVEAERALDIAWEVVQKGSGDRSARADVLSLVGSLRMDQARFDLAAEVLAKGIAIHRADGNLPLVGKLLVQLASAHGESGDLVRAVAVATEARRLLKEEQDERLFLIASQTLATWLSEAGQTVAARKICDEMRPRFLEVVEDGSSRLRLEWLGARVAWGEGALEETEGLLREIRNRFYDRDEIYRYCLVSLDLAVLFLEQGRTREVREMASELAPAFASRQVHHHALAALVLFQQAAEREEATVAFVRKLARYLHHSQKNPYLPFRPKS